MLVGTWQGMVNSKGIAQKQKRFHDLLCTEFIGVKPRLTPLEAFNYSKIVNHFSMSQALRASKSPPAS